MTDRHGQQSNDRYRQTDRQRDELFNVT